MNHTETTLQFIRDFQEFEHTYEMDGNNLTIPILVAIADNENKALHVTVAKDCVDRMKDNSDYLKRKVQAGLVVYGINSGLGSTADERDADAIATQRGMLRVMNAGFGESIDHNLVRSVIATRANCLARAYSGVRPEVVNLLLGMLNVGITPIVPKRGSVSASGDLMPTSYIAATMMGRPDARVFYDQREMSAPEALQAAGFSPIEFEGKEGLAVVNSASFASSLGAKVLFDGSVSVLFTQLATAMSVECMQGHSESFHPTVHRCLPHRGNQEVASNILGLLKDSSFVWQMLGTRCEDIGGRLKQDRYALRSSPQWLGPAVETMMESIRRINVELNSTNDDPIIDHLQDEIINGANFQGTAISVAMDQTRQTMQLCGRLLFAQLSEMLNVSMNNGLPPNLSGSNPRYDFGFRTTDVAMASYMSELDFLANNITNHINSTDMNMQNVNSLALISARYTYEALSILQMMLANIFNAHVQAIDLRILQREIKRELADIFSFYKIDNIKVPEQIWPWYTFAFTPEETARNLCKTIGNNIVHDDYVEHVKEKVGHLWHQMISGDLTAIVAKNLGEGNRELYLHVRKDLGVKFNHGDEALDVSLKRIFDSIQQRQINTLLLRIFDKRDKHASLEVKD